MNEVLKNIRERRSIRKFTSEMPKQEDIDAIVEAGLYAPSGMGKQTSKIVVITNKEVRDHLSDMNRRIGGWDEGFDPFYGAPVVLLVLAEADEPNHVYDGALTMENLQLAASSLGLGSIWINRAKQEFESEEGKALLKDFGIEGNWEGIAHCVIGYPDGEKPEAAPRKPGRVVYVK